MAEYHVGCGIAGIYAGILKTSEEWKDKSCVTMEAISAVAQYLQDNKKGFQFKRDGVCYVMVVSEFIGEVK